MRLGNNPTKEDNSLSVVFTHRIVIPVYIPSLEDYFKEAAAVLELCIESLLCTVHTQTAITIINNNSCSEVSELLRQYLAQGKIHQLIENAENKGKIDAVLSVVRGSYEPLVTIADADVFFERGWMEGVEKVMAAFPETGLVTPCPVPKIWNYATHTTIIANFFRIKRERLISKERLLMFPKSIGEPNMYVETPYLLTQQFYIERNGVRAVLGAGHFVATIRKQAVKFFPSHAALLKLGGKSMRTFIDYPIDKAGYFRLATDKLLAHHIGNMPEKWMYSMLEKNQRPENSPLAPAIKSRGKRKRWIAAIPYQFRDFMISIGVKFGLIQLFTIKK